MAKLFFRGDAQGRAQVSYLTPANVIAGAGFTATINRKDLTYVAKASTLADVCTGLALKLGQFNNSIPEFAEVSAAIGYDTDNVTPIRVVVTGLSDGTPFTISSSAAAGTALAVTVSTLQNGRAALNMKQRIRAEGPPTGGNFQIWFPGFVAGTINWNDNAAAVKTAIETMGNVGAGNTNVVQNGTADWTVEFIGALAATRQATFTQFSNSLTGGGKVNVTVFQEGRPDNYNKGPIYTLTVPQTGIDQFRFKFTGGASYTGPAYYSKWIAAFNCTADDIRTALEGIMVPIILATDPDVPVEQAYTLVDVTGPTGGPFKIVLRDGHALIANTDLLYIDSSFYSAPGLLTSVGTSATLTFVSAGNQTGVPEIQEIALPGEPGGGSFTLTFEGSTTAAITIPATRFTVRDALCNLGNIGGTDEVQTITVTGLPTGGTFTVNVLGFVTGTIAFNAIASVVQAAIEAVIGTGNCTCSGGPLNTAAVNVTFKAQAGRQDVSQMTLQSNNLTGGTTPSVGFATTTGGVIGKVAVTQGSGTQYDPWIVNFQGGELYNATISASTKNKKNWQKMTGNGASLTGLAVRVEVVQDAQAGQNELQEVSLTGGTPTGGTFTLTYNAETTAGVAYNAAAATVQTAIEALATPVPGDISVTGGPLPSTPIVVEFKGQYANSNVASMTGSAASLTMTAPSLTTSNIIAPTGPYHWDEPENWSGGVLPTTGDKAYVANIATDIKFGLTTISATLAEVHFMASFTGQFGLKPVNDNGYFEYRQQPGALNATLVLIGEGIGGGSTFISIDAGTVAQELIGYGTGAPDSTDIPAVLWKGTNAANIARLFKGSYGICLLTGEVATMATLQIGYLKDRNSDVEYAVGPGITLTAIQISGGDGLLAMETADAASLNITGGSLIITGTKGITTTFVIAPDPNTEPVVIWNSIGTLGGAAPTIGGAGKLDFSQDMRAKTVTNPIVRQSQDAVIDDPFKVVTNLRITNNKCSAQLDRCRLGSDTTITRS